MTTEGVVAIGDSIVNADESWAYWLAQAGGWSLTRHSVGGATSTHVLSQLPSLAGHRYAVGALSLGTNDALFDWDAERFGANVGEILSAMADVCDQVLVQTIPLTLMRFVGSPPRRRAKVEAANRAITEAAAALPACHVVDGSDLTGRLLMSVDRVHPTITGSLRIADRAATTLGLPVLPTSLMDHDDDLVSSGLGYVRFTADRTAREIVKRVVRRESPA